MRQSRCIFWVAVFLTGAALPASAQRLFARQESVVYEITTGGSQFGRARGPLVIPAGCGTDDPSTSRKTWVLDGGRFLAWDRDFTGGVCLLNTLAGTVRSLDVPAYAAIVAAQQDSFGLVVAEHVIPGSPTRASERLHVLNDPLGLWLTVTLTSLLPPPPLFGSWSWTYDIAEGSGELVIVQSTNFYNRPAPLLTRVALATHEVVSVTTVAGPLFVSEIAVSRDGTRVVLLCDDWYEHRDGLFLIDSTSGAIVTSNTALSPLRLGNAFYGDSLVWDEAAGRLLVVVYPGGGGFFPTSAVVLDAATLTVIATLEAPRLRLPLRPEFDQQWVRFTVLADPATHTVFLVENEGQTFRRSSTANLRTALYAVDLLAGRVRDATDLAAWYGGAVFSLETQRLPGASTGGAGVGHCADDRWQRGRHVVAGLGGHALRHRGRHGARPRESRRREPRPAVVLGDRRASGTLLRPRPRGGRGRAGTALGRRRRHRAIAPDGRAAATSSGSSRSRPCGHSRRVPVQASSRPCRRRATRCGCRASVPS